MADAIERWLPVVGYEGYYEVSDQGRVRRVGKSRGSRGVENRIVQGRLSIHGYPVVGLTVNSVLKLKPVHRLVLFAFVGPPPEGYECDHKNGNRADARLVNLEWVTRSENNLRVWRSGRRKPKLGEQAPGSKLTEEQVREIRSLRGVMSGIAVAARFGLGSSTVYAIWNGESWGWLE